MITGTDLIVDAVACTCDSLTAFKFLGVFGTDTALTRELAFTVGDDHFQPTLGGAHRLLQRLYHHRDGIGAHRMQPFYAHRTQGLFYIYARRRAGAAHGARRDILLAGGRGVAVLHHDQHAVAFVEHV